MASAAGVLIIGVGNELRGDDGAGPAVVAALAARGLPGARLVTCQGDGLSLLETWRGAGGVILIDAVTSGGVPGAIYRFDARAQALPAALSFTSTHAFGVAEAIELARALDQLPPSLVIYVIEGEDYTIGAGLSPAVNRAVADVMRRVAGEVGTSVTRL